MIDKREYQGIQYLVYYPINYIEGQKYPVVFHLHGSGSRGRDFVEFKDSQILANLDKGNCPWNNAICVFPQCYADTWFDIFGDLLALVKYIYNQPFTDKNRFNISGVSMGGYASYQVLMSLPILFNKALICCGGGMYWNAGRIKDIKFRIFHGAKDQVVYPEEAKRMYQRLKEVNADAVLTIYDECDHNCWDKTYNNFDNLQWLIS